MGCGITGSFAGGMARHTINRSIVRDLAPTRVIIGVISRRLADLVNNRSTQVRFTSGPPAIVVVYNLRNSNGAARATGLTGVLGGRNEGPLLTTYSICHPTTVSRLGIINRGTNIPIFRVKGTGPIGVTGRTVGHTGSCNGSIIVLSATNQLRVSRTLVSRLGGVGGRIRPGRVLLIVSSVANRSTIGITGDFGRLLSVANIVLAGLSNSAQNNTTLSMGTIANEPVGFTNANRGLSSVRIFRPSEVTDHVLNVNSILALVRSTRGGVSTRGTRRVTRGVVDGGFSFGSLCSRFRRIGGVKPLGNVLSGVPNIKGRLRNISVSSERVS